jgi:hypothetical protein
MAMITQILISIFLQRNRHCYPLTKEVVKGYSNATVRPSVLPYHPCEHSRINILQWILTKLGTYLVRKRIWNPIDFQGQRSRSLGQILRRVGYTTLCVALVIFLMIYIFHYIFIKKNVL